MLDGYDPNPALSSFSVCRIGGNALEPAPDGCRRLCRPAWPRIVPDGCRATPARLLRLASTGE
jgi:hypothetical protein